MNEPTSIKVVLLGESGVGKTSIINQFISKKFNPKMNTSVSAQFTSKIMEFPEQKRTLRFDIWDTVGQEKYRSLAKIFYKDAKIIILVYDITTDFSFTALKDFWYKETLNFADNDPIFAIVANKIDLYEKQTVDNNNGRAFAEEINALFQTTSALSNSGISNLFENLGKKIIIPNYDFNKNNQKLEEEYLTHIKEEKKGKKKDKGVKINNNGTEEIGKKKKCC
jgi:small GTP-binding protein